MCVMYTVVPSLLSCVAAVLSLYCLGWLGWVGPRFPGADGVRKPPGPWKVSDLDIVVDPVLLSHPETQPGPVGSSGSDGTSRECIVLHKRRGGGTCEPSLLPRILTSKNLPPFLFGFLHSICLMFLMYIHLVNGIGFSGFTNELEFTCRAQRKCLFVFLSLLDGFSESGISSC